jgi:hypothetical protein
MQPGVLRVSYQTTDLDPAAVGQTLLANLEFSVSISATAGETSPLDIEAHDPNELGLTWTDVDGSVMFTGLSGDYNQDGEVGSGDYVIWRRTFGNVVPPFSGADGDGDGVIDQDDYDVWTANFGNTISGAGSGGSSSQSTAAEPASVPESEAQSSISEGATAAAVASSVIAIAPAPASVSYVSATVASPAANDTPVSSNTSGARQSVRDEALAGFATTSSSSSTIGERRTGSRVHRSRDIEFTLANHDALLIDVALADKQTRVAERLSSICDDQNEDGVEAIDELFADLDSEELLSLAL